MYVKFPDFPDCFRNFLNLSLIENTPEESTNYHGSKIHYMWHEKSKYNKEKYLYLWYDVVYSYKNAYMNIQIGDNKNIHTFCSDDLSNIYLTYNITRIKKEKPLENRSIAFKNALEIHLNKDMIPNEIVFDKHLRYKDIDFIMQENSIEYFVNKAINENKFYDIINQNRISIEKFMIQFMDDVDHCINIINEGHFL